MGSTNTWARSQALGLETMLLGSELQCMHITKRRQLITFYTKSINIFSICLTPLYNNIYNKIFGVCSTEFVPSLLLANVMSLLPKVDEVRVLASQRHFDFLFITETWLKDIIGDNQIALGNFNLITRDRFTGLHGGVCIYTRVEIKCKRLNVLENPNFEVLNLFGSTVDQTDYRGITCIMLACVYHPPSSNDCETLEYLFESLTKVEGLYLGCAFIIAGDFDKLDTKILKRNFQLKQRTGSQSNSWIEHIGLSFY